MSLDFPSVDSGRHRSGVVLTAVLSSLMLLVLCGAVCPLPVAASDRDTPAYLIYVDPVTGKYTTTKPDANAQAVSGPMDPARGTQRVYAGPPPIVESTIGQLAHVT